MRVVALLFGLLGAAGSGFLGAKWMSDLNEQKAKGAVDLMRLLAAAGDSEAQAGLAKLDGLRDTSYALMAAAVLAVIACVVVMGRKGAIAAALFFIALVVPIAMMGDGKIAIFTFGLAIAGFFAFFVKPKPEPVTRKRDGIPKDADMV